MKFEEMPKIFGADIRKVEVCNAADLKNAGAIFTSYGIQPGETVEIPQNREDVVVVKQASSRTRADGTRNLQYMMSVVKTNSAGVKKNDWLSLGSLVRRDANQEPIDEIAKAMLDFDNIEDRIQNCLGKKITCKGRETRIQQEFLNGVRTGNTVERPVAIYAWA